jgi:hypothetical protein
VSTEPEDAGTKSVPPEKPSNEPPSPPAAPSRLKRFSPFVLVAGLIASAVYFIPHVPRERQVELRLEDPSAVVGVELSWSAIDNAERNEGEPLGGTTWRFKAGAAPALLKAPAHLVDGRYALEITLDRAGDRAHVRRLITVGDDARITVPLR